MLCHDKYCNAMKVADEAISKGYDEKFMKTIADFCADAENYYNPTIIRWGLLTRLDSCGRLMLPKVIDFFKRKFKNYGKWQYLWFADSDIEYQSIQIWILCENSESIPIIMSKELNKSCLYSYALQGIPSSDFSHSSVELFEGFLSKHGSHLTKHELLDIKKFGLANKYYASKQIGTAKIFLPDDSINLNRFFNDIDGQYEVMISKQNDGSYTLHIEEKKSGVKGPIFFIGDKEKMSKICSRLHEVAKMIEKAIN